jgi:hypothetical protein
MICIKSAILGQVRDSESKRVTFRYSLELLKIAVASSSSLWYLWKKTLGTPNHLLLDSAPNLGPLLSRWEINKFSNWWYKSVRILVVLRLLFQQFLNLSSSAVTRYYSFSFFFFSPENESQKVQLRFKIGRKATVHTMLRLLAYVTVYVSTFFPFQITHWPSHQQPHGPSNSSFLRFTSLQ